MMEKMRLSRDNQKEFLTQLVTCFELAKKKENREAIFNCNTLFLLKICNTSYKPSPEVYELVKEILVITNILFQEALCPEEPSGIQLSELDFDEKNYYKVLLNKALA